MQNIWSPALSLLICRSHYRVVADFFLLVSLGQVMWLFMADLTFLPSSQGDIDLFQGPVPGLSYRCFFCVRCIQMPCCCPFPYSVSIAQQTAWSLLLHLVGNYVQLHALAPPFCFPFSTQNGSCKYFLGPAWFFFVWFVKGKLQIISDYALAMYFSSDGAHGYCLAVAPAFFMCAHLFSCQIVSHHLAWSTCKHNTDVLIYSLTVSCALVIYINFNIKVSSLEYIMSNTAYTTYLVLSYYCIPFDFSPIMIPAFILPC